MCALLRWQHGWVFPRFSVMMGLSQHPWNFKVTQKINKKTNFSLCVYCVMSAMSNSVKPYGLQAVRSLCLWDSPGKNIGVDFHALLQGIFLTQGSNTCLLHLPALAGGFFTTSATCEAQFYSEMVFMSIITTVSPIRASFLFFSFVSALNITPAYSLSIIKPCSVEREN